MKKTFLVLLIASAFAAACQERKTEARPDYEGTRAHSENSHQALDKEAHGY